MAHCLLKHSLQRVITHIAVRLCAGDGGGYASELLIGRKIRTWCSARRRSTRAARLRHQLAVIEGDHEVSGSLSHTPYLQTCIVPELVLNSQVPLIVEGGLHFGVPHTKYYSGEARIVRTRETRGWRRDDAIRSRCGRQRLEVVGRLEFASRGSFPVKRWIDRQAQVGARPF